MKRWHLFFLIVKIFLRRKLEEIMEKKSFDLAIIGSGPGGYIAAIRGAQMGQKVALIENCFIGGCCLNVGCIPTKSLLAHAEALLNIRESTKYNIHVEKLSFDYSQMVATKNRVIHDIRRSLEQLILSNQITILHGHAKFSSPKELKIEGEDNLLLYAQNIIIATGSESIQIPSFPFDNHRIHSSSSILTLTHLPSSLIIIGGGYIGCEFASLYSALGVKITLIEALPSLLFSQGAFLGHELAKSFRKQGIELYTSSKVERIEKKEKGLSVHLSQGETLEGELALVCVGRKPKTDSLDLQNAGLDTNSCGAIVVNEKMETSQPGIYAIGDVTGKWMLAHVASHQGIVAASNVCKKPMQMHYHAIPSVIFTHPQIASVGLSLGQAQKEFPSATCSSYSMQALGKAIATLDTTGFVQIISDPKTGQIFGAHMIGREAASLIGELTLAIQNHLPLDAIVQTIHAHPTLGELWQEAAFIAKQTPLHFPPKKKT
jgi:dihydrolipoamide dehydrogenase